MSVSGTSPSMEEESCPMPKVAGDETRIYTKHLTIICFIKHFVHNNDNIIIVLIWSCLKKHTHISHQMIPV